MRCKMVFCLIMGIWLLRPATVAAQEVPPVSFLPFLSHPHYESGGWFVGLDFLMMHGPTGSAPSSNVTIGYLTEDETVYEINWMDQWFTPTTDNFGNQLFPTGAKLQIIDFTTRLLTYKTECFRSFTTFGPRVLLFSQDFLFGNPLFGFANNYNVDNNMVGVFVGCIDEWYLGSNPLGAFSFTLEGEAGGYLDFVRQVAGTAFASNAINSFAIAGTLQAKIGFIWYPYEGISIHVGYDLLAIINAQVAKEPVNIVGGGVNATLNPNLPFYYGIYLGIGLVF